MIFFSNLPNEINDKIFLLLFRDNYHTLFETREIQSDYVKRLTAYDNIYDAIKFGNLDNIKWVRANGHSWNNRTFMHAVRCGNLVNMNWLINNGCPWQYNDVYSYAISYSKLHIMQWLKEKGYYVDIHLLAEVDFYENLENS